MTTPNRKAPWLGFPLPDEIYREVGLLIAHWAYFEMEFDEFLDGLLFIPEARALTRTVPSAYAKRAKLMRAAAAVCFPTCPALIVRLGSILDDAASVKVYRDLVAHGRWGIDKNQKISAHIDKTNGTSVYREITADLLLDHTIRTSELSRRIGAIIRGALPFQDFSFLLTPEERNAISDYLSRSREYWPNPARRNE